MFKWLHHLLDPHCQQCAMDREVEIARSEHSCKSCEILKAQLEITNYEKKELLNRLINPPVDITTQNPVEFKPIQPRTIPWRVQKQQLEAEDRVRAQALKNAPQPVEGIEDLEKELEINNGKG